MEIKPYSKEFYAQVPSRRVLRRRKNLLWQFVRFIVINWKMTVMIVKSHRSHVD